jgi:hypothetical protein
LLWFHLRSPNNVILLKPALTDIWIVDPERSILRIQRYASIGIWTLAAWGIVWILRQPTVGPTETLFLFAVSPLLIPLLVATAHAPVWMARWISYRNRGNPRIRLSGVNSEVGLAMEFDLRKLVPREMLVSQVRQICGSTIVIAITSIALLFTGWLILGQPWMFATLCAFAALLAWRIYPSLRGVLYRMGLLTPETLVRRLYLRAMAKALMEPTPIEEWHPGYFEILRTPADGSIDEYSSAAWIYTHALLHGDMETAARYLERQLDLLPEDSPNAQYASLGDALYFCTFAAPDENKSKLLAPRIRAIDWELPMRVAYIEAAIALAEGRPDEARSIVDAGLLRAHSAGDAAWIQLQQELLTRIVARPIP